MVEWMRCCDCWGESLCQVLWTCIRRYDYYFLRNVLALVIVFLFTQNKMQITGWQVVVLKICISRVRRAHCYCFSHSQECRMKHRNKRYLISFSSMADVSNIIPANSNLELCAFYGNKIKPARASFPVLATSILCLVGGMWCFQPW